MAREQPAGRCEVGIGRHTGLPACAACSRCEELNDQAAEAMREFFKEPDVVAVVTAALLLEGETLLVIQAPGPEILPVLADYLEVAAAGIRKRTGPLLAPGHHRPVEPPAPPPPGTGYAVRPPPAPDGKG